ncbi:hydroxymyristoyl-ACP dehydratase [Muricauda sp. JGD-17]|uniref:Hydroxymyristoyl-ACP dehydratase n=1 Tax=Flagellimonas ochracea TaxID=2696472 RepID=A0A964T9W5_9FLAO|nr:FabA/FabZ family ACP-dehydratase [Allomuricauda ochracea]NAY90917.1 hydroxymyristoyl-ACP dehydratase [Allomuricauda ochracea]
MNTDEIIQSLPYSEPFLFVDELLEVDAEGAKGVYTFRSDMPFYEGHFKGNPITPGVILTECCAQIGLVCLGIYLVDGQFDQNSKIALTSSEMEFLLPVFPGEKVIVTSKKVYFRFHKLKCSVKMFNEKGELVCRGTISGIINSDDA